MLTKFPFTNDTLFFYFLTTKHQRAPFPTLTLILDVMYYPSPKILSSYKYWVFFRLYRKHDILKSQSCNRSWKLLSNFVFFQMSEETSEESCLPLEAFTVFWVDNKIPQNTCAKPIISPVYIIFFSTFLFIKSFVVFFLLNSSKVF